MQAGVKQEVGRDGKLEIERRLLENDAEPRQRRHRVVRHVVAHDLNAAGIRHEQPGQQLKQRGLAGTVGAEQRNEFAGMDLEADAVDGTDRPIGLDHVVQQQSGGRSVLGGSAVHDPRPLLLARSL